MAGGIAAPASMVDAATPSVVAASQSYRLVKNQDELNASLSAAKAAGKPVILEIYAEWSESSRRLNHETLADPRVKAVLAKTIWLRVDITANTSDDQAVLKRFNLFGAPAMIFFESDGTRRDSLRLIGFMQADEFAARASRVLP
jgi:thiol:disulfide interchange protein DsbD